jgi:hypothetical protein
MYKLQHNPKADICRVQGACEKERRKRAGTNEMDTQTKTINVAECLNTNCKEDQFVNIDKSHK